MRLVGFVVLLLSMAISHADVVVLSEAHSPALQQLVVRLSDALAKPVSLRQEASELSADDIVILAGDGAVTGWRGKQHSIAVWARREAILANVDRLSSGIFSEPPLQRQLDLARAAFPGDQISVLMSDSAPEWLRQEASVLSGENYSLVEKRANQSLNHVLRQALAKHDVILGTADPAVFNASTIKNILITAYRQNIPLVGPHQAYIRAGAIVTTYSSLDDTVARLVDLLSADSLPPPAHNPYFSVLKNEQVARSLDITLPDNIDTLLNK